MHIEYVDAYEKDMDVVMRNLPWNSDQEKMEWKIEVYFKLKKFSSSSSSSSSDMFGQISSFDNRTFS